MPFQLLTNKGCKVNLINPDHVDIFMVPGIHGAPNELMPLAMSLDQASQGKRRIFIYEDELHKNPYAKPKPTLLAHAKELATQVLTSTRCNTPVLIGYSYGCLLVELIAQHLYEAGSSPMVILLDGSSKELTKSYYNTEASTRDMLAIFNMAAISAGLKPIDLTDSQTQENIQKNIAPLFHVNDRAEKINKLILDYNEDKRATPPQDGLFDLEEDEPTIDPVELYKNSARVIKQNFANIASNHNNKPMTTSRLPKAHLVYTHETQAKIQSNDLGWLPHFDTLDFLNEKDSILAKQTHLTFIKSTLATRLSQLIVEQIRIELPKEFLLSQYFRQGTEMFNELVDDDGDRLKIVAVKKCSDDDFVEVISSEETSEDDYTTPIASPSQAGFFAKSPRPKSGDMSPEKKQASTTCEFP